MQVLDSPAVGLAGQSASLPAARRSTALRLSGFAAAPARRPGSRSAGFVPVPQCTVPAFSAFVGTLRLAADEGDRSHHLRCSWQFLSQDMQPIQPHFARGIRLARGLSPTQARRRHRGAFRASAHTAS